MTFAATLSLLTPVASAEQLPASFDSLRAQTCTRWQWVLLVAADTGAAWAADRLAAQEPRITVVATHAGPPTLADGLAAAHAEYVAVLWSGDRLDPAGVADVSTTMPGLDWCYTDDAALGPDGEQADYWYKPDFSPELLRSQPYTDRLGVVRRTVATELGLDRDAGDAAWYDLALRLLETGRQAHHMVGPYYLRAPGRPTIDPGSAAQRCAVLRAHLDRCGIPAQVSASVVDGVHVGHRIDRRLTGRPRVSVVVPTAGTTTVVDARPRLHVAELVAELWTAGRYPDLELIIVYDRDTPQAALDRIDEITGGQWIGLRYSEPFNFSRKCNAGALAATGELVCFLNDDIQIGAERWLEQLVALLQDPQVAAVAPRLLYESGALQHAGHIYRNGVATHLLLGHPGDTLELSGLALATGERSGLTAACLLVRRSAWEQVGGFSEDFPLNYNDVDFCLKLREQGWRLVYTPLVTHRHFESQSRVPQVREEERRLLADRWGPTLERDPYLNPVLQTAGWLD